MKFTTYYSGSSANLYTVSSNGGTLLIEAGVRIKAIRKALKFGLSSIDAALITHSHGDHAKGAKDIMSAGIDTYMSAETAQAIGAAGHRLHIIEPLKQFSVGRWNVLPLDTQHDAMGSLGFLISDGAEKLLFATDTFYLKYKFRGLTIIAIECNYSDETIAPDLDPARKKRLLTSHFSLANVKRFLQSNDLKTVREIHLLHLSDENSDAEYFKTEIQKQTGKPVYVAGE